MIGRTAWRSTGPLTFRYFIELNTLQMWNATSINVAVGSASTRIGSVMGKTIALIILMNKVCDHINLFNRQLQILHCATRSLINPGFSTL